MNPSRKVDLVLKTYFAVEVVAFNDFVEGVEVEAGVIPGRIDSCAETLYPV